MSLLERLEKQRAVQQPEAKEQHSAARANAVLFSGSSVQLEEYADQRKMVHSGVITLINEEAVFPTLSEAEQADFVRRAIETVMIQEDVDIPRGVRAQFVTELYNDILGLGPLEPLLADPDITEVMVNGPDQVYVEIRGKIEATDTGGFVNVDILQGNGIAFHAHHLGDADDLTGTVTHTGLVDDQIQCGSNLLTNSHNRHFHTRHQNHGLQTGH